MVLFVKTNIKWLLILFVGIFAILTVFFSEFNGMTDGLDRVGFPIVFLQDTGGKCIDCEKLKWFNLLYLLGDLAFSFLISLFIVFLCLRKSVISEYQ